MQAIDHWARAEVHKVALHPPSALQEGPFAQLFPPCVKVAFLTCVRLKEQSKLLRDIGSCEMQTSLHYKNVMRN